jgi:hypothetical protein
MSEGITREKDFGKESTTPFLLAVSVSFLKHGKSELIS